MNVYLTLCVTVCLATLFVTTLAGILAGNLMLGLLRRFHVDWQLRSPALSFCMRMFPFLLGVVTTFTFVLPSFLLLEPKQTPEIPEPHLLSLAGTTLVVLCVWTVRWIRLTRETHRKSQQWLRTGHPIKIPMVSVPVRAIESPESLVAVTGIFRTRVFIGREALATLTMDELQAVVAHELAHIRSFDNLKQLLVRITRLPRWLAHFNWLDSEWSHAAEFSADRGAVQEGASPLDLASALVKISRLRICDDAAGLACHLIPARHGSAVAMRVQHLQNAFEDSSGPRESVPWFAPSFAAATLLSIYLLMLPTAMPLTHKCIEWLVR